MSHHFQGKSVIDHLKEARLKGALATSEIHGSQLHGSWAAAADSAKDTALTILILWALSLTFPGINHLVFAFFSIGWIIWKAGRSALAGWAKLERLHRVIEEERWEIEHHREQERAELTELYRAKGFQGKMLEEVISILMADDNRLLGVMLEEELGLPIEVYEHPLKQALGAGLGALSCTLLSLLGYFLYPPIGAAIGSFLLLGLASTLSAHLEKRGRMNALVWNLSLGLFCTLVTYYASSLYI